MMNNKSLSLIFLSMCATSMHTFADGYINENAVIFISEEDPDQSPWKDHPQCLAKTTVTDQKGIFENQYTYQNGNLLTSIFLSTTKIKKGDCENLVHFPDDIQGNGVFETYFPNGKARSRIEYENGEYQGKLQFWLPNGLKQQESMISNGETNGEYKIWHPNGQLALSMKYKDGVQNGMKQRWYESGEPWSYVRFENDRMVGELKQWFTSGKLERQGEYKNGLRHGIYKAWFKNGKTEARLHYQFGKITSAECWNEAGKTETETSCIQKFKDEE